MYRPLQFVEDLQMRKSRKINPFPFLADACYEHWATPILATANQPLMRGFLRKLHFYGSLKIEIRQTI